MKMRLLLLLGWLLIIPLQACHPQRQAIKAERRQEQLVEQRKKEEAASRKAGLKRHVDAQDKITRKRMKDSRRKSERLRPNRKPTLWQRVFKKKR